MPQRGTKKSDFAFAEGIKALSPRKFVHMMRTHFEKGVERYKESVRAKSEQAGGRNPYPVRGSRRAQSYPVRRSRRIAPTFLLALILLTISKMLKLGS